MYISDWDTFAEQAEALYRSDPLKTRYVLKYRHCDGKAVLKVTDDKTVRTVTCLVAPMSASFPSQTRVLLLRPCNTRQIR